MTNRDKPAEIVEIVNGQMKCRWGVGLNEIEFVRYNALYNFKVGDKGILKYQKTASMSYFVFLKD